MKSKIFRSTFIVSIIVLLSSIAIFMGVLYEYFSDVQDRQLQSELKFARIAVEERGLPYLEHLGRDDERLTLIAPDGKVIYDSWADASQLENHGDREEVQEAFQTGEGQSSRYSSTFMEESVYYAAKLADGKVLRIADSRDTVLSLLLAMEQSIFIIFSIALILSGTLAFRIAKQISEPLNTLDLDRPLENDTYEEIAPLLTKIEQGRREIATKKDELQKKEEEFNAVTQNMDEGLILMNSQREIISINPAASLYYDTDNQAVGRNLIMVDRSLATAKLLDEAEEKGSADTVQEHKGRIYQVRASSIKSGNQVIGMALLIFDITDKAFAERNRKEFTANVSHELKTPLHSIMGSAELIEQGLVDKEDMPEFAGMIRKEATRLLAMIGDIIRLSELDEKAELPLEEIELKSFIAGELEILRAVADKKNVTIRIEGDEAKCLTSQTLVAEIIGNLGDNAVKYNKDCGSVTVNIATTEDMAVITVADTGIGIPLEHQARIFERFYRVDKSHSRDSGGTGLGLSIVKHAVQYLNGTISLKSEEGKGTVITVEIPRIPDKI